MSLILHQYFLEPSVSMCTFVDWIQFFLHFKEILCHYVFELVVVIIVCGFSDSS